MMLLKMVLLLLIITCALAEEQRTCYKCRVKNQCQEVFPTSVEKCRPDVHQCVKKTILSKVTGAMVTERYCGGRDFLNISAELVEDKCYTDDIHSRTTATICYCSTDYCNSGNVSSYSLALLLSVLPALLML